MSRQSSNSPETSLSLHRRAVLKSLAAVPLGTVAATGQASSSPQLGNGLVPTSLAAAVAADERFAEFDRLASEIVDLDLRQEKAFEEYDEETRASCTEESQDDGSSPWVVLWSRLVNDDMARLASEMCKAPDTFLDVVLQFKIADYYFAVGDADFDEVNEICPISTRNFLKLVGLRPQVPIKELRSREPAHVAQAKEFAAIKPRTPMGVNAGNLIIRIRDLRKASRSAISRAGSFDEDTPEWLEADAEATRLDDKLDALRDEIIAGVNRVSSDRNEDDPYSMSQAHLFAVWIELIEALSSSFFDDLGHGQVLPVIQQMRREAPLWSETFIEQATRWNAEQGVANV